MYLISLIFYIDYSIYYYIIMKYSGIFTTIEIKENTFYCNSEDSLPALQVEYDDVENSDW